ncbi:lasso peptide biosynthesis protein [Janthinobacterium psychrotolerans]|uniref:Transglutaminase-like superfamily protein n=1 Tax=Janthinobacterium psychrotolerans TaxID=1747903 RepID=A0A1A7C555_9BURK|nr:lasso peptide biosynthesis protein [Janthinobacterium psychrotolerans]OBV41061.1 Transglutaminase-like superfamily protein [Janthinobacterium psychrotolerans]
MNHASNKEIPEERKQGDIFAKKHRAHDHGEDMWLGRMACAKHYSSRLQTAVAQKEINGAAAEAYRALLLYVWDTNYFGACHSTSAVLFILLSEMGLKPHLCIGEVRFNGPCFDHSWVELDGEIFDVAISLPLPTGRSAGGPVFASVDLHSGKVSNVRFGISDGVGLDSDALVSLDNTLNAYAEVQRSLPSDRPDIWVLTLDIAQKLGLRCTVQDLIAKYGTVRREYRRGSTSI